MSQLIENICKFFIQNSSKIIKLIIISNFTLVAIVIFIFFKVDYGNLGKLFGQIAVIFYVITLMPGIFQRLKINHIIFSTIRIYRRYFGIAMYLFALSHFFLVNKAYLSIILSVLFSSTFELMGAVALLLLFFLFITSNNFSQRYLGVFWNYLHKLTYLAMFFIFLHVAFQRFSVWTFLLGLVIVLEIISFLKKSAN